VALNLLLLVPVALLPPLEGMVVEGLERLGYYGLLGPNPEDNALHAFEWRDFYLLDEPWVKLALRVSALLALVGVTSTAHIAAVGADVTDDDQYLLTSKVLVFAYATAFVEKALLLFGRDAAFHRAERLNWLEFGGFAAATAAIALQLLPAAAVAPPSGADVASTVLAPAQPDSHIALMLESASMGLIGLAHVTLVMKLSSTFGPLVLAVNDMVAKLMQWMTMLLLIDVAFSLALHTFVSQVDALAECADLPEGALGESLFTAGFYLFRIAIKYGPRANTGCFWSSPFVAAVMCIYDVFSALMLFKMLTAFLTHAFHQVTDNAAAHHLMNLGQLTLTSHIAEAPPPPLSALVLVRKLVVAVWSTGQRCRSGYSKFEEKPKEDIVKPKYYNEEERHHVVFTREALLTKIKEAMKEAIEDERPAEKKWQEKVEKWQEKVEKEFKELKENQMELKDLLMQALHRAPPAQAPASLTA
jgi:hypothetical protein